MMDIEAAKELFGINNIDWEEPFVAVGVSVNKIPMCKCLVCEGIWPITKQYFCPGKINIDPKNDNGKALLMAWKDDSSWWKCPAGCWE